MSVVNRLIVGCTLAAMVHLSADVLFRVKPAEHAYAAYCAWVAPAGCTWKTTNMAGPKGIDRDCQLILPPRGADGKRLKAGVHIATRCAGLAYFPLFGMLLIPWPLRQSSWRVVAKSLALTVVLAVGVNLLRLTVNMSLLLTEMDWFWIHDVPAWTIGGVMTVVLAWCRITKGRSTRCRQTLSPPVLPGRTDGSVCDSTASLEQVSPVDS